MKEIVKSKKLVFFPPGADLCYSPVTAYLFGVLQPHITTNKNLLFWLISNFMNPCIDINLRANGVKELLIYEEFFRQDLWYSCPFILSLNLKPDLINGLKNMSFIEFVKEAIDLDYFVYADINKHYIPNYKTEEDWQHNMLILGYDKIKGELDVADYFRQGRFSLEKCGENNVNMAFQMMKKVDDCDKFNTINLFRYQEVNNYKFNLGEIKEKLKDYLNATNLIVKNYYAYFAFEFKNSGELYYGIQFYDALIQLVINNRDLSVKSFHLLVMHKKIMKLRLEILKKYGVQIENLYKINEDLINETIILRNLIIKESIKRTNNSRLENSDKQKLIDELKKLKENDVLFTEKLISFL